MILVQSTLANDRGFEQLDLKSDASAWSARLGRMKAKEHLP
jgi:hypothetical protein